MRSGSSARTELTAAELAAVTAFLRSQDVEVVGELRSTLIAGGRSNLTFRLEDTRSRWVMRTPPRAGRTPSAHDVAREFRVTSALHGTEVPVARPVAVSEDDAVLGAPLAVWEFVPGRALQARTDLDPIDDATLATVVRHLLETLAALHRIDHVAVGLERFGRPDGYAGRQVRRWSQQWDVVAVDEVRPLGAEVATRLAAALPEQLTTGIVHGDFRIDNTLVDPGSPDPIRAVVDWELSTIGDPVADVAMMCVYRQPVFDEIVGAPAAWTSPRIPDVAALAGAYEAVGGVQLNDWGFHLSLAYYKIAVIAAGIAHRVRAGAASGVGFDSSGGAVRPYLELALATIRSAAAT